MATYPVGLPTGTVTLSIYELIGDLGAAGDADDLPDAQDVTLTVELVPGAKMIAYGGKGYRLRAYTWTGLSVLTAPDGVGSYVLPSTDTLTQAGTAWQWQARISVAAGSATTQLMTTAFSLASGATVDLLPLIPIEAQSLDVGALVIIPPGSTLPDQSGQAGKVLTTDGAAASWGVAAGSVPDATSGTKGKLALTGDLGGTADSPTVPGLAAKAEAATVTAALAAKAPLANPTFTGTVTLPATVVVPDGALAIADTAGLQGALDAKSAVGHTHTRADISDATTDGRTIMAAPALPALDVWQASNGIWPSRPSWAGRINWVGYPALTSTPSGMTAGDTYMQRA